MIHFKLISFRSQQKRSNRSSLKARRKDRVARPRMNILIGATYALYLYISQVDEDTLLKQQPLLKSKSLEESEP